MARWLVVRADEKLGNKFSNCETCRGNPAGFFFFFQ
jgi:hypothetical protein